MQCKPKRKSGLHCFYYLGGKKMNKQIDITGVVLTTDRLTLRPWRESDLNDFYEYASVDGVV